MNFKELVEALRIKRGLKIGDEEAAGVLSVLRKRSLQALDTVGSDNFELGMKLLGEYLNKNGLSDHTVFSAHEDVLKAFNQLNWALNLIEDEMLGIKRKHHQ